MHKVITAGQEQLQDTFTLGILLVIVLSLLDKVSLMVPALRYPSRADLCCLHQPEKSSLLLALAMSAQNVFQKLTSFLARLKLIRMQDKTG